VATVPEEIRQTIFTQPDTAAEPLVRHLVAGVSDDFLKVKILHDWIADNIDYDIDTYLAGGTPESSWQATLTRRKAFCQGYADLLQQFCKLASVPCETVSGYGRGYGFSVGQQETLGRGNHAWNAVMIDKKWRLVDVTWDAGNIEGRAYRKQYNTAYLFADPQGFVYTHFPEDARWQLLDRPLSAEEFKALPFLEGRFFSQGLRLSTPLRRMQPCGESIQFSIAAPDDVLVMAQLDAPGNTDADKFAARTQVRRDCNGANVLVTFPAAGPWGVKILTKARKDRGLYWQAGLLEFNASAGTPWTFAETFSSVSGIDSFLEGPVYAPLPADKPQEFKIRVRGAEQVQLRVGEQKWIPMQAAASEPELYTVTAAAPAEAHVQIVARPPHAGNTYWTIVDYGKK